VDVVLVNSIPEESVIKATIIKLLLKSSNYRERFFKEEGLYGQSSKYKAVQYHFLAAVYSYLFYTKVVRDNYSIAATKSFLKYDEIKKCFSCASIDIDSYLKDFFNPLDDTFFLQEGIGSVGIEYSLEVEGLKVQSPNIGTIYNLNSISEGCTINTPTCADFTPIYAHSPSIPYVTTEHGIESQGIEEDNYIETY
jgi:hypothetical protein